MSFNPHLMLINPMRVKDCVVLFESILCAIRDLPDDTGLFITISETIFKDRYDIKIINIPGDEEECK